MAFLNPATSSGKLSADTQVWTGPGRLLGVQLIGDATNAATLFVYDVAASAAAANGNMVATFSIKAGGTESVDDPSIPQEGIVINNGIWCDVTGTGASYIVLFSAG